MVNTSKTLYRVMHQQYATDRYVYGTTVVEANSPQEAMDKLNAWLATKPDGVYTGLPCKSVNHAHPLEYIS